MVCILRSYRRVAPEPPPFLEAADSPHGDDKVRADAAVDSDDDEAEGDKPPPPSLFLPEG